MINKNLKFLLILLIFCFFVSGEIFAYDYSSTKSVPIKLSILQEISTKAAPKEGQKLEFRVVDNVFCDGKLIIKKNTKANATLETIITSGMNGFPAEIIIRNFELADLYDSSNEIKIKNSQLIDIITKKGQNRALWVYPLKWALTPIPFVGSLTNLIKGGHAKITPEEVFVIYYYPEWE